MTSFRRLALFLGGFATLLVLIGAACGQPAGPAQLSPQDKASIDMALNLAMEAKTTADKGVGLAMEAKTGADKGVGLAMEAKTTADKGVGLAMEAKTGADKGVGLAMEAKTTADKGVGLAMEALGQKTTKLPDQIFAAHFVSSAPKYGDTLTQVSERVTIDFDFVLLAELSEITVTKDGTLLNVGKPTFGANKLSMYVPLPSGSGKGLYVVDYKACWPDRSCHTGKFAFTVT